MKRIICSLLIISSVILLTGCTSKEIDFNETSHIVCTKTENEDSETTEYTLTFSYDEDENIKYFKAETNINYGSKMSKKELAIMEKAMKLLGKAIGLNFKSEVKENELYYSFTGDMEKYKKMVDQTNGDDDSNNIIGDTKQEILEEAAQEGFTCIDNKK